MICQLVTDSSMPFAQHRDIFYLSGVDQEESILLCFSDALMSIKDIIQKKRTHISQFGKAKN
jgi:Xaa-Pro aminopeptidase